MVEGKLIAGGVMNMDEIDLELDLSPIEEAVSDAARDALKQHFADGTYDFMTMRKADRLSIDCFIHPLGSDMYVTCDLEDLIAEDLEAIEWDIEETRATASILRSIADKLEAHLAE